MSCMSPYKLLLVALLLPIANSRSTPHSRISRSRSPNKWYNYDSDDYYDDYDTDGWYYYDSSSAYDRNSRYHLHERDTYDANNKYKNNDGCIDKCTNGVKMPNFCKYAQHLWDDPDTPLDERNNIGLAKYLTSKHVMKAASLMNTGKVYKLAYAINNNVPTFSTARSWFQSLRHDPGTGSGDLNTYYEYSPNEKQCGVGMGGLEQRVMTSSIGNTGTQFDGLGHVFYINGDAGDSNNYVFHNGFTGFDVMTEFGANYIGIEQLPPFITRAILLDVSGYIGSDPLPEDFQINTDVIDATLKAQGLCIHDIEEGDVILFYTGWAHANYANNGDFYYSREPGITLDTIINIFSPNKVLLLGADNWGVEYIEFGATWSFPVHAHWLICNGGFLYESLNLFEWVTDARNGDSPYIGGFYWAPAQIEGGVGGLGTPMVVV